MFTLLLYFEKFFNQEIFLGVKVSNGFIGTFCVQNYFTMQKIGSMSKFYKITVYFIHGFDNTTIINHRMQQKGLYMYFGEDRLPFFYATTTLSFKVSCIDDLYYIDYNF